MGYALARLEERPSPPSNAIPIPIAIPARIIDISPPTNSGYGKGNGDGASPRYGTSGSASASALVPPPPPPPLSSYGSADYVGHIASIAVHSAYRGQGVAQALMKRLQSGLAEHHQVDDVNLFCRVSWINWINAK